MNHLPTYTNSTAEQLHLPQHHYRQTLALTGNRIIISYTVVIVMFSVRLDDLVKHCKLGPHKCVVFADSGRGVLWQFKPPPPIKDDISPAVHG